MSSFSSFINKTTIVNLNFKIYINAVILIAAFTFSANAQVKNSSRNTISFNNNWDFVKDAAINFNDLATKEINWKSVSIPHDWTAKTPYNQTYKVTDTTPALGGIGWYKKEFTVAETEKNKQISIEFDGIYNNSTVWINGKKLGFWPYGYTAFSYDLTPHINFGKTNELLVKVDRTAFLDSRWYPGAGIYRNVNMLIKNKIHIPKWGIRVSTPKVLEEFAEVLIETKIVNANFSSNNKPEKIQLLWEILDAKNSVIASAEKQLVLKDSTSSVSETINLKNPKLWSPNNPYLYTLQTKVIKKNAELDVVKTNFGVRYFNYDADKGFSLNGKKEYFKGVCLHHAAGALGAAVPDEVWLRRLKKLKEAGVNAIRTAHNPASKAFLNLCDSLGFLVQEEIFDELDYPKDKRKNYNNDSDQEKPYEKGYTEYFQKYGEKDLKSMLNRDFNHPSIIMWSIGNELEWTYPRYGKSSGYWNSDKKYYFDEPPITIAEMKKRMEENPPKKYELAKTVQRLSKVVKSIDTTRAVTANLVIPTVSHFSGYTDALDIVGYSYRASVYDYGHKHYPEKMLYGSENWATYVEWESVLKHDFIPGIFLWAGIHYMGETSNPEMRGSQSGVLDYAGFPTPRWYMFKSLWNPEPVIYATTYPLKDSDYKLEDKKVIYKEKDLWRKRRWSWQKFNKHWNYNKNEEVVIEVFTNCPEVELFVNNVSKGRKKLANFEDHLIKFVIPFEEGEIKAVGLCENEETNYVIKTAGNPATIKLTAENFNSQDNTIHVVAKLLDANKNWITNKEEMISFRTEGGVVIKALENGSNILKEVSTSNQIKTNFGQILIYLEVKDRQKPSKLFAKLPDGTETLLEIIF